jgi:hypothetical protein
MIGCLRSQAFIKRDPEKKSFSIHRLVQARIIQKLHDKDDSWACSFDKTVQLLFDKFPQQQMGMPLHQFHEACNLFLPHVQRLAHHYKMCGSKNASQKFVNLLHNATWWVQSFSLS